MGSTPHFSDNTDRLKKEAAAFAFVDAGLLTCNRLVLTRTPEGNNVHGLNLRSIDTGHITQVLQMWEAAGGNCNGIGFDF